MIKITRRELKNLYRKFKRLYFKDRVPLVKFVDVAFSGRLSRCAGLCYHHKNGDDINKKHKIRLSPHYHERHPEELESTLIHEMIHLYVNDHKYYFIEELNRINRLIKNKEPNKSLITIHSLEPAKIRHKMLHYYECKHCGVLYTTKRKYHDITCWRHKCKDGTKGEVFFKYSM